MTRKRLSVTNNETKSMRGKSDAGQNWVHTTRYCPKCHASSTLVHRNEDCDGEWYLLPGYVQVPRINSSKKTWELFNKRFVKK